ncbi:MAG TPA: hypothetical protein VMR08_04335 [Patescibacteria group bacterium]|nr:hypothetical protein [Patescibacteria group bacterium]
MANYPSGLVKEVIPIPETIDQTELNKNGLFVVQGLDLALAEQLVEASDEAAVRLFCQDDAEIRFESIESIIDWAEKGRLSLPLVRHTGDSALTLAGLGWMRPGKPDKNKKEPIIPGAETTFAIRIYGETAGHGYARFYTKSILDTHGALIGNKGVWLAAWGDNEHALRPYDQNGFIEVDRVPMTRKSDNKVVDRVFMTLGHLTAQTDI